MVSSRGSSLHLRSAFNRLRHDMAQNGFAAKSSKACLSGVIII